MATTQTKIHNLIALDVGDKRVGVAITNTLARLPRPYVTLVRDDTFWDKLQKLMADETITQLVVGLPRSLDGNETAQTRTTREFIAGLEKHFSITVVTQDEALTSRKAEHELHARGRPFAKGDIDALAATYILEDYLKDLV